MIYEKIFYIFAMFVFLIYYICLFVRQTKKVLLLNIITQTIAVTIITLSYIKAEEISAFLQTGVFVLGILIPVIYAIILKFDVSFVETYYLVLGDINYLFKKYEITKEYFEKAINYKSSYRGYKKLGNIYIKLKDYRNAFDAFASAVEIKKDDYKSYYQLGFIYEELGKRPEAITVLNSGLRIKPDYTPISNLLAIILCEQNNFKEALRVYNDSLKYKEDDYQTYYNMAVIYTNINDYRLAQDYYKKAIRLNNNLYDAYLGLGQIYLTDKNFDNAEKCLFKATNKPELYAKAYYSLAKLYALRCEEGKVVSCLKLAIDNDTSYTQKALDDPLFSNIKDFIIGLNIITNMENGVDIDNITNIDSDLNEDLDVKNEKSKLSESDILVNNTIDDLEDVKTKDISQVMIDLNKKK